MLSKICELILKSLKVDRGVVCVNRDSILYIAIVCAGLHLGGGRGGRWPPLGRISPPLGIVSLLY